MSSVVEQVKSLVKSGQYDKALVIAQQSDATDDTELLYLKAVAARYCKRFDQAASSVQQLLAQKPGYARALQEAGHIYRDQHQFEAAAHHYRLATHVNPSLLSSWQSLVICYRAIGQMQYANDAANRVAELKALPKPIRVARDLLAENKLARAEKLAREFLRVSPLNAQAMLVLADIGQQMGSLDESLTLYKAAVRLQPNVMASIKLIQLLRKMHCYDEALGHAKRLLDDNPSNPQCMSVYAIELMQVGRYAEAVDQFALVIEMHPSDATAYISQAHALKTLGEHEAAVNAYRKAISINASSGEAWYSLANLKTVSFDSTDVDQMTAMLDGSLPLSAVDQTYFHFALGKACEDLERFDDSFSHYQRGNAIKRAQSRYDGEQLKTEFLAQTRVFQEDNIGANKVGDAKLGGAADSGYSSDAPIFVVGLPRAGSTLVEQILSSHSKVDGTLELPNILAAVHRLRAQPAGYPDCITALQPDQLNELGRAYIEDTQIHRKGAPYFIDKMPNNFRHIGLMKSILPNAKIIDIRRNPLDCCFSGFKQLFAEGQEFSYSLADIGAYYREYVTLMDHWQRVYPDQILQVNYEQLVEQFEPQVDRMLRYCGLALEERCYSFHKTKRAVRTASSEQVRQPINKGGIDRFKPYLPHLQPLVAELSSVLDS